MVSLVIRLYTNYSLRHVAADINPPSFYFSPDFLDTLSGVTKGAPVLSSVETSSATLVQNCKKALHQRVLNRTPLLNSVLEAVESMAKELWDDLAALEGPLGQTRFASNPEVLSNLADILCIIS